MKKKEIDTAARFGLLDRLQALENDLTAIPGTTYIDFDLSGLYDHCPLCFVVGYDIDVNMKSSPTAPTPARTNTGTTGRKKKPGRVSSYTDKNPPR